MHGRPNSRDRLATTQAAQKDWPRRALDDGARSLGQTLSYGGSPRAQWTELWAARPALHGFGGDLLTARRSPIRIQERRPGRARHAQPAAESSTARPRHWRRQAGTPAPSSPPQMKPGTKLLLRTWQGRAPRGRSMLEKGVESTSGEDLALPHRGRTRAITGAHWSGPRFFGLVGRSAVARAERSALRHLHAEVFGGGPRAGVQLARCPARSLRGLHPEPGGRGLEARPHAHYDDGGVLGRYSRPPLGSTRLLADIEAGKRRHRGGLQGRPAHPLASRTSRRSSTYSTRKASRSSP